MVLYNYKTAQQAGKSQWGPEKGKVQSISAGVVEAEIMSEGIGLPGGL